MSAPGVSAPDRAPAGGRIAVGVSGGGSNLRALVAAADRGELGGSIVLVFADRPCPALDWAAERGIETALVPTAAAGHDAARAEEDATLAATLIAVGIACAANRVMAFVGGRGAVPGYMGGGR